MSMMVMTRVGVSVLEHLNDNDFVKGLHSVGKPLEPNQPGMRIVISVYL